MCKRKRSFAERRDILNKIPKGIYCHEAPIYNKDNNTLQVNVCPYWKSIGKYRAKCTLYNIKDKHKQALTLLWDQVKICGLKEDFH